MNSRPLVKWRARYGHIFTGVQLCQTGVNSYYRWLFDVLRTAGYWCSLKRILYGLVLIGLSLTCTRTLFGSVVESVVSIEAIPCEVNAFTKVNDASRVLLSASGWIATKTPSPPITYRYPWGSTYFQWAPVSIGNIWLDSAVGSAPPSAVDNSNSCPEKRLSSPDISWACVSVSRLGALSLSSSSFASAALASAFFADSLAAAASCCCLVEERTFSRSEYTCATTSSGTKDPSANHPAYVNHLEIAAVDSNEFHPGNTLDNHLIAACIHPPGLQNWAAIVCRSDCSDGRGG